MNKFTHLHVHSEYSLLDGMAKIPELLATAKSQGMNALALTDHGGMYGSLKFYVEAKKAGVKPIIGVEGYLAQRGRKDKEAGVDSEPFHLLLLAKNKTGYQNLLKLVSKAYLEGFYYKPRMDKEILRQYSEGLICLSGCISAEIPHAVRMGNMDEARKLVREYIDIFGEENFYIEIQDHNYEFLREAYRGVVTLAREFGLPMVATNDVHYVLKEDALAQDILLAIQTKTTVDDPKRKLTMRDSQTFYLRTPQEMASLFAAVPEALDNTQRVVDAVDLSIPMGEIIFPFYQTPKKQSAKEYLKQLAFERVKSRYAQITPQIKERLAYELDVISQKGYETYFLIVQDFVNWAKSQNIAVGPGRGSAAGSLVSYVLRITDLDPIKHDLPFERFLNPSRPSPPDIDIDIADVRRDEVIEYVRQKYGKDHVAQIVTFGTMEARAAVRDVGRAMGLPYAVPDRIAKLIPFGMKLTEAIEHVPDLQNSYEEDSKIKDLIDVAKKLEGVSRHASTHAAGVVISDKPLVEYVPLQFESRGDRVITQYDMYSLDLNVSSDALGLLKMDLLGLRNLSILQTAIEIVQKRHGTAIDISNIPLDEPRVFDLISSGYTIGVFQLESGGMRGLALDLRPTKFSDISAMVALYRPGPMDLIPRFIAGKKDPDSIHYEHPDLKPILEDSYGILLYQEQCLEIANQVAGYSLGEADILRRAIGKKKKSIMDAEKKKFIAGAQKKGYSKDVANTLWGFIEKFAGYGFNRAHSASYAMIAYQTAYLKALYPVEFMTALLIHEANNADKISRVIEECRRMHIQVLPPDINTSDESFIIDQKQVIRFGLSAIKNVGMEATKLIIEERNAHGIYASLEDMCRRVSHQATNKKVLESFAKAGVFDCFGKRTAHLAVLEKVAMSAASYQKQRESGQVGLFDNGLIPEKASEFHLPDVAEAEIEERLFWEKELLGFFISEHPASNALAAVRSKLDATLGEIDETRTGTQVITGGLIVDIRSIVTRRRNEEMAFVRIEDAGASIELVVFPSVFQKTRQLWQKNTVIVVSGRVDNKEEKELKIIVEYVYSLQEAENLPERSDQSNDVTIDTRALQISLDQGTAANQLEAVRKLLVQFPGDSEAVFVFGKGSGTKRLVPHIRVNASLDLIQSIETLLGRGSTQIV